MIAINAGDLGGHGLIAHFRVWVGPVSSRALSTPDARVAAMLDHEEKFLFKEEILHLSNAVAEPASSTTSRTC